jgi:dTMP kinase
VKRGLLVAFEGLDGSGKSTQLARQAARLRAAGLDVVATREPTQGEHGRRIREMAAAGERAAPEAELALFLADRREHVAGLIARALARGAVVLTDRYFLSTVAYQGARGLDPARLLAQSEAEFPLPDLALLFELEPRLCLERVHARGGKPEPAFERLDRLERVEAAFRALARPYLVRLDASGSIDEVGARVDAALAERLTIG